MAELLYQIALDCRIGQRVYSRIREETSFSKSRVNLFFGQLTIGKVNVFGDLVPGAVVKVSDLLLVLHHVGWLPSLLVLHCNVVLNRLKILPMLDSRGVGERIQYDKMVLIVCATHVNLLQPV